jgi:predicted helicase
MVTNNGFVDGVAFDGMRKHLLQDFDAIYHLDMAGNARTSGERRLKRWKNALTITIPRWGWHHRCHSFGEATQQ